MKSKLFFLFLFGFLPSTWTSSLVAADAYRQWNFSLPVVSFGGEGVTKFEVNLKGSGALGVEVAVQQEAEFFSEEEMEENANDSLMMKGTEVSLAYSSYGNPKMLSGGFWSVGLGYRDMQATWQQTPKSTENISGLALTSDGKIRHRMGSSGATARARIGYRFVASSVPFSAGAYIGVRHFQNQFRDLASETGVAETASDDLLAFERRIMSRLEPGIELGFSF